MHTFALLKPSFLAIFTELILLHGEKQKQNKKGRKKPQEIKKVSVTVLPVPLVYDVQYL